MSKKNIMKPTMLSLKIVNDLFGNKEGITIKNLANNLNTDYKNIHDAVMRLFDIGIINKERIGNYNVCKLNYSNEDVIEYLKEYNFYVKATGFKRKYPTEYRIIVETCEQSKEELSPFFICLVFGSYTKNEEKKDSDIDLLFLTLFSKAETTIKKILSKINVPYQKKFHVIEQSIDAFVKDLKNKDKLTIATELYKELPIVFYGDDTFFRMVMGVSK